MRAQRRVPGSAASRAGGAGAAARGRALPRYRHARGLSGGGLRSCAATGRDRRLAITGRCMLRTLIERMIQKLLDPFGFTLVRRSSTVALLQRMITIFLHP